MATREQIELVVRESGLWDQGREKSHGFLLSPTVYTITATQRRELEDLGKSLSECLMGLGRIAVIAFTDYLSKSPSWAVVRRVLDQDVPKNYRLLAIKHPNRIPAICKVDLMEGEDGQFYIAEIDGHNKHGLGYSTLAARVRRVIAPDVECLPGVATSLSEEVKRRSRGTNTLVLVYSDQERFYLPEFQILASEMATHGIRLVVISELEMSAQGDKLSYHGQEEGHSLFVDLPFLYRRPELRETLGRLYEDGEVDFLIPPKPFFGAKAVLALLRNDLMDPEVEAIVRSQIPIQHLERMRRYIPETYLVQGRVDPKLLGEGKRFVLKATISSGMKGTIFSDSGVFAARLAEAQELKGRYILQREVTTAPRQFRYYQGEEKLKGNWYMRVTAHYARAKLADVVVTARQDKRVHGAKDSLQVGTIILQG